MKDLTPKKLPKELRHAMQTMGPQFKLALPSHISPERFTRIVFTAVQRNPKLLDSTQESVLAAVMRAAEQGLMPDGRQGSLVPYYNNKTSTLEAQWIPMWQGLLDLARQSGAVDDAYVASVRENDEFEYELGLERKLTHKPALRDRGEVLFVYAVILLSNGTKTFGPGPMTVDEVNAIRNRSKAKNHGPWVTDWEAMAWKTVLKRALKYVPQSSELQQAIEQDNAAEFGEWKEPEAQQNGMTVEDLKATNAEWDADERKGTAIAAVIYGDAPEDDEDIREVAKKAPTWPRLRGDQVWVDSSGTEWNPKIHAGADKHGVPAVNKDGTFRAKRGHAVAKSKLSQVLEQAEQHRKNKADAATQQTKPDVVGEGEPNTANPASRPEPTDGQEVDVDETNVEAW